jgi:hypothetical protein
LSDKRGKGTRIITHSWPCDKLDEYEKIKRLAPDGISHLSTELLLQWLAKQESKVSSPIGHDLYRYNSDNAKHWIDSLLETKEDKQKDDLLKLADRSMLTRISE